MTTDPRTSSRGRTNLALATLFLGTFVVGSAELLVVGALNLIADDLQVSILAAGTGPGAVPVRPDQHLDVPSDAIALVESAAG